MPLNLPSLNLTGVGLPRVGVGVPSPRNIGPKKIKPPVLFSGSTGPPGFDPETGLMQDDTSPVSAPSSTVQSATVKTGGSGDMPNWVAILAPLLGAGLGAAMGGKKGALQGATAGFSGVGQGMAGAAEIKRKAAETGRELDIRETEAATRKITAESMVVDREDRLLENEIKNAVKTRVIQKGKFTPEVEAQIKASIEDEEEQKAIDEIEAAKTPDALDGIKTRILGNEWIGPKTSQGLIARAEQNKAGLEKKLARDVSQEEFDKQSMRQELEIKRLTQESLAAQRDIINAQKTQEMLRNAVEVNDWDTYVLINPSAKREQFDELRDNRIREQALTWDLRNPKIDPATGGKVARTPDEIDNIARSLGAGRSKPDGVGYDETKVSKAVSDRKGKSSPDDIEHLKEAVRRGFYTQREADEIAKRLGLAWTGTATVPTVSDTTKK